MTARRGMAGAVLVLAAVNVSGIWLPGWTYLPVNAAAGGALLAVARRAGASDDDLGLARKRLGGGIRAGLVLAAGFSLVIALLAVLPATRAWFDDTRAGGVGVAGLLYQVGLRIPVGTALFEEFAFRGVLLGLGRRGWGRVPGSLASAGLFGLWHIVPALDVARTNATAGVAAPALVAAAAVVGTAAAGLVFNRVLDRARSLAAPVIVHAVVNATAFGAAWLVG